MKFFLITLVSLIFLPITLLSAEQQVVDIDIEGMSCKFCAHSVQKSISKLPYVETVKVNIDTKHAKIIVVQDKEANIEQLKKKIIDSGFTPVKVTISTLSE